MAEALFGALADHAPVGMFVSDTEGSCVCGQLALSSVAGDESTTRMSWSTMTAG